MRDEKLLSLARVQGRTVSSSARAGSEREGRQASDPWTVRVTSTNEEEARDGGPGGVVSGGRRARRGGDARAGGEDHDGASVRAAGPRAGPGEERRGESDGVWAVGG